MTWQEIKLATLQKMFSSDGNTIDENDDAISEYLNAMPQAANEALQMLATAGRYIRKSTTIEKSKGETFALDMTSELKDFYRIGTLEVYSLDDNGVPTEYNGAAFMAGKYMKFPEDAEGIFEIFYDAKPTAITLNTPDDTKINLPDDAVVLLPLYMASQLYKDDDIAVSTYYRNEFEVAFERLKNPDRMPTQESWGNNTGWW